MRFQKYLNLTKTQHIMLKQLHLAAQYLAVAGINFVDKKADDSHTNLGWDSENLRLTSRFLANTGFQVGLNYTDFSLEWLKVGEVQDSLPLHESSHNAVVDWVSKKIATAGIEGSYNYSLHYDIPYNSLGNDFRYELVSKSEMHRLAGLLSVAQNQFQIFLQNEKLDSEIRVWPHHFDLGIYTEADSSKNLFVGAGLAVPDSLVDDLYYYISGYKDGESMAVSSFLALSQGKWADNWDGGVMASTGKSGNEISTFLIETLQIFRTNA
ncbi:MAG: hypothetical protein ACI85I_002130 [Arenicella sp.]|jgi:hypothetical protein